MHQHTGTLSPTPPFDLAQTLAFLTGFPPLRGEQTIAPAALTKAIMVNGQPLGFQITAAGTIEEPRVNYTLSAGEALDAATIAAAEDRLTFFLGLDDDLRPFYAIGRADPAFAPVIEQLYGYHQIKFPTPFENACWAILTQRTPMAVAARQKAALTARYGGSVSINGTEYAAFPDAAALANADPDELTAIVGTTRRTNYLLSAAEAFTAVDEQWLRTAPWGEVERWLLRIKGVGAWSASFVLIRGLGRMEALPSGEGQHSEIVSRLYLAGKPATAAEVARIAAPYDEWQGYWAHYLRAAG
jgi:DNA-3-methyladenine glycosylase II